MSLVGKLVEHRIHYVSLGLSSASHVFLHLVCRVVEECVDPQAPALSINGVRGLMLCSIADVDHGHFVEQRQASPDSDWRYLFHIC